MPRRSVIVGRLPEPDIYNQHRLGVVYYGPEIGQGSIDLRGQLINSILSIYSVPPALLDNQPSGNTSRESARRFYQSVITPVAEMMQREIELV